MQEDSTADHHAASSSALALAYTANIRTNHWAHGRTLPILVACALSGLLTADGLPHVIFGPFPYSPGCHSALLRDHGARGLLARFMLLQRGS